MSVFISEDDAYLFGKGRHYDIYRKLGAHPSTEKGKKGYFFAVWAPDAASVHVVGNFNDWNESAHPMTRMKSCGIWSRSVSASRRSTTSRSRHLPSRCKLWQAWNQQNAVMTNRLKTAVRAADPKRLFWKKKQCRCLKNIIIGARLRKNSTLMRTHSESTGTHG